MSRLISIGIIFITLAIFVYLIFSSNDLEKKVKRASSEYVAALTAETVYARQFHLNQALTLLLEIEAEEDLTSSNGRFYNLVGNIYFELHSYPFALLYYMRAAALQPLSYQYTKNINRTLERLQLSFLPNPSMTDYFLFFHKKISLPRRLQLIFILGAVAVLGVAASYFWKKKFLKRITFALAALILLFTLSVLTSRYVEPMGAVLVHASMLYKQVNDGENFASSEPLPPGTRVTILDVLESGAWLKVITAEGSLGFVRAEYLRVI